MTIFLDLHGHEHERPDGIALDWRISCYTIAMRDGKILMTEPRWSPKWELPGGRVDVATGETIVAGAARECLEETGYILTPDLGTLQLVMENFFCFPTFDRYFHALAFVVRGTIENDTPISEPDPAEIVRIHWADPAELTAETMQWMHFGALQKLGVI